MFFQTAGIGSSPKSVIKEVSKNIELKNTGSVNPKVYEKIDRIEPDYHDEYEK